MGREYVAYAASQALIEKKDYPKTSIRMVVNGIMNDDQDMLANILLTPQMGLLGASAKYRRYGQNKYARGLPTGKFAGRPNYTATKEILLNCMQGKGIAVSQIWHFLLGYPDDDFFLKKWVKEFYNNPQYPDFFPWANGPPPIAVWDEGREGVQPSMNLPVGTPYVETTEIIPSVTRPEPPPPGNFPPVGDPVLPSVGNRIFFKYGANGENTWEVPVSDIIYQPYASDALLYMVLYEDPSLPGQTQYYVYRAGEGGCPALDEVQESISQDFMPVAILMQDTVLYTDHSNPYYTLSTDRLLKRLDMDGEEILADLKKAEEDDPGSNGDPDKWDMYLHFAAPISTTTQGTMEYLFKVFWWLQSFRNGQWRYYQRHLGTWSSDHYRIDAPKATINIKEGGELGYDVTYEWATVERRTFSGTLKDDKGNSLKIGKYQIEVHRCYRALDDLKSETKEERQAAYNAGIDKMYPEEVGVTLYAKTHGYDYGYLEGETFRHDYVLISHQNRDNTYTRMLVMGLHMEYKINTRVDPNSNGEYRFRYASPGIKADKVKHPDEKDEFIFPISLEVLRTLAPIKKEDLLANSLHMTFFLTDKVHVPWYQSGFLKFLVVVIIVIILVWAQQYHALAKFIAVAADYGISATVAGAIYGAVAGFLVGFAGSLIGGRLGQLFVIVASIYNAGGMAALKSNLTSALTGVTKSFGWASAVNFINIITPFIQFAQQIYNDQVLAELESGLRDFSKSVREKQEELDDAWAGLDSPPWLDPMDMVNTRSDSIFYEGPSDFIARTTLTNPGILAIAAIGNFVPTALDLPSNGNTNNPVMGIFNDFRNMTGAV